MNIAIIGTSENEKALVELCKKSKNLSKIYTASNIEPFENVPNIEFYDIEDLAKRLKSLQIDIILTSDKHIIQNGLAETAQKYRLNPICMNKKWINIEKSKLIAKQLTDHYNINTPKTIGYPSTFPVVMKLDNSENSEKVFPKTMQELFVQKEILLSNSPNNKVFIEEYLEGVEYTLVSIWDKASMYYYPILNNETLLLSELNEVQKDRLDLLKTKMNFMFSDEKADFLGFILTRLIWSRNDWYVLDFQSYLSKLEIEQIIAKDQRDFLFVLNSAIYQKLNEIG